MLKLERNLLGSALGFITGHNRLKHHEHLLSVEIIDSICRLCLEEEETAWHLIGECPSLVQLRANVFHT